MKIQRLDITGAQTLALVGSSVSSKSSSNRGINQLFKIDEDGNLKAVRLEVLYDGDGTETVIRTDITVHPNVIYSICNSFTYLCNCCFFDGDGNEIPMNQYYEPDNNSFDVLVQNSTGKIFYIPEAAQSYFPKWSNSKPNREAAMDKAGNLYTKTSSGIAKISFIEDMAQLTPYSYRELIKYDSEMHILDNGTLVLLCHVDENLYDGHTYNFVQCLYSNGGFEELDGRSPNEPAHNKEDFEDFEGQKDRLYFSVADGKLMAIKLPKENFQYYVNREDWSRYYYLNEEVSIELVNIEVGTSYGSIEVSDPLTKLSGTNDMLDYNEYNDYVNGVWERGIDWTYFVRRTDCDEKFCYDKLWKGQRYWFIGNILAYDTETRTWIDFMKPVSETEWPLHDNVIQARSDNMYKGKAWDVSLDVSWWFDIETLECGFVQSKFEADASNYTVLSTIRDIPHGKIKCNVISPVDGKKYIISIDIETGEYTQAEQANQDLDIIELIPMN